MKRFFYFFMVLLVSMTSTSCSDDSEMELGFTPTGLPITLCINSNGEPNIRFNGKIVTPVGAISLSSNITDGKNVPKHVTYVEIINRIDYVKHVIELVDFDESVEWDTKNSHIKVHNRTYSTIVTVESDEITNFLHKQDGPGYKPHFPETPYPYFHLVKQFKANVNWEVNSVADFIADVIYIIIGCFAFLIDIVIILVLFIYRSLCWIVLLVKYLL